MAVVDIEIVGSDTRERLVYRFGDVFSREAAVVDFITHREKYLARDSQGMPRKLTQDIPHHLFALSSGVHVSDIKEIDT
jgi:hypothetical protein